MLRIGLAALALASVLTVSPATAVPANCPSIGLGHQKLTIITDTGRHRYSVETAATPTQQECGLMFRRTMASNAGMIFPSHEARLMSFWMENTYLPLDIIFVGADGRVVNVAANAVPLSRDLLDSKGLATTVVELNAGQAEHIRLKPGDRIQLQR